MDRQSEIPRNENASFAFGHALSDVIGAATSLAEVHLRSKSHEFVNKLSQETPKAPLIAMIALPAILGFGLYGLFLNTFLLAFQSPLQNVSTTGALVIANAVVVAAVCIFLWLIVRRRGVSK